MEPSPIHALSIESRHLLIGVVQDGVKPHLNAAAAAPAVVADLVGVTPDFIAQSSRRGEVEVKAVAGSFHRALVIPCGENGRPVATRSRTISCSTNPTTANLHKPFHTPTTPSKPLPSPHLRSSPSPCASCSCRCRRCGSLPTSSDSPLCTGAHPGPALCATSG